MEDGLTERICDAFVDCSIGNSVYDFRGKVVYLSGPVTGIEGNNAAEFAKVGERLAFLGAESVYDPVSDNSGYDIGHSGYMLRCLGRLTEYRQWNGKVEPVFDVLVLLDGWSDSAGSMMEMKVAHAIGIDVVRWRDVV